MKNRVNLKKYLIMCTIIFLFFVMGFYVINQIQYSQYTRNVNAIINQIVAEIQEKYPDVDTNEIIQILNREETNVSNVLLEYGINIEEDSVILKNDTAHTRFLLVNIAMVLLFFICIVVIFGVYQKNQRKKIDEITKYIEEINNRNYALDIQDNSEDELSILKNELYKITVMLKEQAENSKNDKISLKKSLEDISHQLKTPLTSITIMLDNILDNKNMGVETRNEFIKDIHREIANMNFFVQTLLKLSKFDADTITFNDKQEKIKDIVKESIRNVSTLCDLKNMEIVVNSTSYEFVEPGIKNNLKEEIKEIGAIIEEREEVKTQQKPQQFKSPTVVCDLKWQVEAITNILKNSVEHSKENSKIYIKYDENNMYSEIVIKDNGIGIDKDDIKHIFERFYKGKNSSKDSVGIGLALAKTIIEKNNGYITVDSEVGKGTTFCIRYLK